MYISIVRLFRAHYIGVLGSEGSGIDGMIVAIMNYLSYFSRTRLHCLIEAGKTRLHCHIAGHQNYQEIDSLIFSPAKTASGMGCSNMQTISESASFYSRTWL